MTKDEMLRCIQTGTVRLHPLFVDGRAVMDVQGPGELINAESFLEAFREHQAELFLLMRRNDIQVCISPSEHRQDWGYIEDAFGKFFRCDACMAMRAKDALSGEPDRKIDLQKLRTPAERQAFYQTSRNLT